MEHLKKIEREDIYANYRGRMPRLKTEPQKSPIQIPRQALERMFARKMPQIIEPFDSISGETESTERLLRLDYAIHISEPNARKSRLTGLDLYCFEKTTKERTVDSAYRVTLEKCFEPRETAVRTEQSQIQRAVLNI